MRKLLASVAIVFTLSGTAQAQDWDKGYAAHKAKDYATALQEWRPLAHQGHAKAQAFLGGMYANGQGVLQDYVMAHMWTNIASANGDWFAAKMRYAVATMLTGEQIAEATKMASECIVSDYQNCGY